MDDERLTKEQRRAMLELLEEAALNDYPNPDRVGCPGAPFLRRLAVDRNSIPLSDPNLDHVATCSPCFREFAAFRDQEKRSTLTRRAAVAAGVAILAAGIASVTAYLQRRGTQSEKDSKKYETAELDYFAEPGITRGASNDAVPKPPPPDLPAKPLDLNIILPYGKPEGLYEIQVLAGNERQTSLSASGSALIINDLTRMRVRLDLSTLAPGIYRISFRTKSDSFSRAFEVK